MISVFYRYLPLFVRIALTKSLSQTDVYQLRHAIFHTFPDQTAETRGGRAVSALSLAAGNPSTKLARNWKGRSGKVLASASPTGPG